jgi:hypothetical protein
MARRYRTLTRSGRLASVFPVHTDKDLNALIASLCVLFEDLRIELAGQVEKSLGGLDECGEDARRFYFLRRSLATLHEFATTLQEIDELPSFQPIKKTFDSAALRHWTRSVAYFIKHSGYLARVRNNVGAHFGRKAATIAISNLLPDSVGVLEAVFTARGGGGKLHFAHEIVATGTLRQIPGVSSTAKARKLVRHALVCYRKATWAVDCITVFHLWNSFG